MFFGNERKKLEEKIKMLEEKTERSCVYYQVLFLLNSLDVLFKEKFLSEKEIPKYCMILLMRTLGTVAQDVYKLEEFKLTEDFDKKEKFQDWICRSSLYLTEMVKKEGRLSEEEKIFFGVLCDAVRIIPSPDPKQGYNISDFKKE